MEATALKAGTRLICTDNPEWGSFSLTSLYDAEAGAWEARGDRGSRIIFASEVKMGFWKVAA